MDYNIIGGLRTARVSRADLARVMTEDCRAARGGMLTTPKVVASSNGSVIARYHADATFRAQIDQVDILDADGMPLVFASRLFCAEPLRERVATTDFIDDACEAAVRDGLNFYFLGAKPGVAAKAAARLRKKHPGLRIVGVKHGYFSEEELDGICADILARKTDVLWLGLGSPRQEALALRLRGKLAGVAWIRVCGGLFDHMSGSVRRAPGWMQSFGLEWLHRLAMEPRRLAWRYLCTNPVALFYLLTQTMDAVPSLEGVSGLGKASIGLWS
ncbi:WecB/TagA/CpsF family glycosyltransferase [Amaricoccus solimangrovi]|nr:WecB/TagA/CpsF family glycosyltransferase [Amaricoccus solimangrovi]